MNKYQFVCKSCGRTTFFFFFAFTSVYGGRVVTREECSHCGYICYNCMQLNDAREATVRKNRIVGTIKENLTVEDDVVNQDA